MLAIAISPTASSAKSGLRKGNDQAAQFFIDVARQYWRLADQNAGDKCAEYSIDADELRRQRHRRHDDQDCGDDWKVAPEIVVRPPDQAKHNPAPDGEARDHEEGGPDDGAADRPHVDRAGCGETKRDSDDHPADRVFKNGGCDDDLPQVATHEIHFANDDRDDLHRRDGKRGAEKDRGDEAGIRPGQEFGRQELAERKAAGERYGDAGERGGDRRAADAAHHLQVGLHAGEEQEHQHAKLGNCVEHAFLHRVGGKDRMLSRRPEQAEERRAEQKTAD